MDIKASPQKGVPLKGGTPIKNNQDQSFAHTYVGRREIFGSKSNRYRKLYEKSEN